MPGGSFQKLSSCKVAGLNTLSPPTLYPALAFRGFKSLLVKTQGLYPSGGLGALPPGVLWDNDRWITQGTYGFSGLLYSSSDNVNFTLRTSGANVGTYLGGLAHTLTGLTTGTSYYYYVESQYVTGGVTYRTRGPTVEFKTREPIQATGGNYTMKWWNRHGEWKMHVYRDSANFVTTTVPRGEKVWCFVLGGGGSGGKSRGGGGGGGGTNFIPIFNYSGSFGIDSTYLVDDLFSADWNYPATFNNKSNWGGITVSGNTTYSITIGAGGGEVNGGGSAQGNDGGDSIAFGITGKGGGGGGSYANSGRSGGCGGGGGSFSSTYYTGALSVSGLLISGYYWGYVTNNWNNAIHLAPAAGGNPSYNTQYEFQGKPGWAGSGNYGGGGGGLGGNDIRTLTSINGKAGQELNNTNSNYFFIGTGLSGTATRVGAGGGGGGLSAGNGGDNIDNGAGDGSNAWGEDYYAYPAGLGGAATWFGCGGGGGGKGGGGGGAGFKGLVILAYATGDPRNTVNGW